jgi:hypothetical protein
MFSRCAAKAGCRATAQKEADQDRRYNRHARSKPVDVQRSIP